eukprot:3305323-Pleurochrysis_carterae.AAC.1
MILWLSRIPVVASRTRTMAPSSQGAPAAPRAIATSLAAAVLFGCTVRLAHAAHCAGQVTVEERATGKQMPIQMFAFSQAGSIAFDQVHVSKAGRIFGQSCEGSREYVTWDLLDRTLSFDVQLGDAGCGCKAGLLLFHCPLVHPPYSYYCGHEDFHINCSPEGCTELGILEANAYAYHASAKAYDDPREASVKNGMGGHCATNVACNDFQKDEYGPNSMVIDTSSPFRVSATFKRDKATNELAAVEMTLTGVHGGKVSFHVSTPEHLRKLTSGVSSGLTPFFYFEDRNGHHRLDADVCPQYVHDITNCDGAVIFSNLQARATTARTV